jgi:NAD(P)-dependent dehydrogenase (short-subunit alcohol dehydrogenase family)
MKSSILVTGATGTIGRDVAKQLSEKGVAVRDPFEARKQFGADIGLAALHKEILMKNGKWVFALLILFAWNSAVFGQDAKSSKRPTISQIEDNLVGKVERALVRTADAMPEDKFSFAPTNGEFKGVRTFAEQVKHVAGSNYSMAAAVLQEKLPAEIEKSFESMNSKAEIMKGLTDSFAYLHKALSGISEKNETELIKSPDSEKPLARLEVADLALWHNWQHYGQMVEYLRMNGIIPPTSGHQAESSTAD